MDWAAAGSAVSGLLSPISTAMQNKAQKKAQQREFANNKEMWNLANQYNSPEMQMARLDKAGLNKNLVYGNGSVVGNTSTQTPKYQAPNLQRMELERINPLETLGMFADLKQKNAEAEKAQSEATWIDTQKANEQLLQLYNIDKLKTLTGKDYSYAFNRDEGQMNMRLISNRKNYHLANTQADYESRTQRNKLQKLDLDSYEKIPKEYRWLLPIAKSFLPNY